MNPYKGNIELRDVFRQVLHHIETLPFKECFMNYWWDFWYIGHAYYKYCADKVNFHIFLKSIHPFIHLFLPCCYRVKDEVPKVYFLKPVYNDFPQLIVSYCFESIELIIWWVLKCLLGKIINFFSCHRTTNSSCKKCQ